MSLRLHAQDAADDWEFLGAYTSAVAGQWTRLTAAGSTGTPAANFTFRIEKQTGGWANGETVYLDGSTMPSAPLLPARKSLPPRP